MRYNTTAEQILRTQEVLDGKSHQFEGRDKAKVRKTAIEVLQILGHRNNVEDIRLDNQSWEISYGGSLPFKDRKLLEQLIAEQLDIPAERIKLVGIGC